VSATILQLDVETPASVDLTAALRRDGCVVLVARSREAPPHGVARAEVQAIVLHATPPYAPAIAWIRELREAGGTIPAILLGPQPGDDELLRAGELGVSALEEPVAPELLLAVVRDAIAASSGAVDSAEMQEAMDALRLEYQGELPGLIAELASAVRDARRQPGAASIESAMRLSHRLRGTAPAFAFARVGQVAGRIEVALAQLASTEAGSAEVSWAAIESAVLELEAPSTQTG
jgi:DNA-binding NtrC family response regulator